jgi:hypothetical protein
MTFGRHTPPPRARNRVGMYDDARSSPTRYTPRARNCVGGIPRHSATTHPLHSSRSQSRGGCTMMFCPNPPPPPLALAIAWGVYHDVRSPLTTPHARNCVGGVPRHSATTHLRRPSRSQSRGGCTTTFGRHSPPPHARNCVGGVPRHSATTSATPRARNRVRGVPRHSAHHPPPAPLALASAWGVYSPTLGPTPPPAPSCLQLHGGVYHNALPVQCLSCDPLLSRHLL